MRCDGDWTIEIYGPAGGRVIELTLQQVVGDVDSLKSWAEVAQAGFPIPARVRDLALRDTTVSEGVRWSVVDAVERWNPAEHKPSPPVPWAGMPFPQAVPVDWAANDQQVATAAMRSAGIYADLGNGVIYADPKMTSRDMAGLRIEGDGWEIEAFSSALVGPHVQVKTDGRRDMPHIEFMSAMQGFGGALAGRRGVHRSRYSIHSPSAPGLTLSIA